MKKYNRDLLSAAYKNQQISLITGQFLDVCMDMACASGSLKGLRRQKKCLNGCYG